MDATIIIWKVFQEGIIKGILRFEEEHFIIKRIKDLIERNLTVAKTSSQSFSDIDTDIRAQNIFKLILDLFGAIGLSITILSFIPQIYYFSQHHHFRGLSPIYFFLRVIGLFLMFIYGYFRHNLAIAVIITTIFSFSITSVIFFVLR